MDKLELFLGEQILYEREIATLYHIYDALFASQHHIKATFY